MTQVHLYWLWPTTDVTPWPGKWLLTQQETVRAARWLVPGRRREFQWGRALLHFVVAQQGLPPDALRFHETGRPFLEGMGDVSLSHAGDHVMVGVCDDGFVGVDVELHQPRETTLMQRFFHDHERAWMGGDVSRLHRLWTLKESALKALGTGVSGNPARVWVEPEQGVTAVMDAPVRSAVDSWWRDGDGVSGAAVHLRRQLQAPKATFVEHPITASDVLGWMRHAAPRQPVQQQEGMGA